jgi:hypothetical protein
VRHMVGYTQLFNSFRHDRTNKRCSRVSSGMINRSLLPRSRQPRNDFTSSHLAVPLDQGALWRLTYKHACTAMAQLAIVDTAPKYPGAQTIAFAISVVLSKPDGSSVCDYTRLLRQHIARGRRENALSSVHRHLDRSSYWRAEYERAKSAFRTAEGEAVDLRREIERLKAQVGASKAPASNVKRRKKVDEDVIPVPRDAKRAKRDASPGGPPTSNHIDVERDLDFSDVGEIGQSLFLSQRTHC